MFNSITGTITGKFPQRLLLLNSGIEWDIIVPDTALDALPPVGQEAKVYVWLQHTDQLMSLFGFAKEADRQLFFDLLKVDGVGPKGGIKIMSHISSAQLVDVLEEGNIAALEKVPGVGKKTAAKMLLQLKGKLHLEENQASPKAAAQEKVPFADVVTSLCNMGYDKRDVEKVIENLCQELQNQVIEPQHKSFGELLPSQQEELLFRRALVALAQ